jgi:hypothetical protein
LQGDFAGNFDETMLQTFEMDFARDKHREIVDKNTFHKGF